MKPRPSRTWARPVRTACPLPRLRACRTTSAPAARAPRRRAVARPIVDDQHRVDVRARAGDDRGNRRGFVEGRHQRDDAHRPAVVLAVTPASSAPAAPAAPAATAAPGRPRITVETSPSERSGGYEEVTSVPNPSSVVAPATRITGPRCATTCGADVGGRVQEAVHHVDAVVDADADEGHHREHAEQVELDARQREQPRPPTRARRRSGPAPAASGPSAGTWRGAGHDQQRADA